MTVQTPLGKGVVREVRNNSRLLVDVRGRAVEFREAEVSQIESREGTRRPARPGVEIPVAATPRLQAGEVPLEVDLHGLTVEEALLTAAQAVNDALLANRLELRFIHGRSGGRIRGALHRWLREVPSVAGFRLDPRNPGVTVATL